MLGFLRSSVAKAIGLVQVTRTSSDGMGAANLRLQQEVETRERAECALAAALERERALFENAGDGICSFDADGQFASASPSSFKVWGYLPEELIGRRSIDLVVPEDVALTNDVTAEIIASQSAIQFENRYLHKDGTHVPMIWSAAWSSRRQLMFWVARHNTAYDVAILDLMMPEMDGFELARSIKSDASIAMICLVLLPSFGQRGDGALARQVGIAGYLTKPVRQSQLFDCLVNAVAAAASGGDRTGETSALVSHMVTRHSLRETRPLSKKLVLLAEDNAVNQKVATAQLLKLGYRADAVANGREAVEALERIVYDLVLMDCQMPEMDGYQATAEIRRREGTARHTPVVAMTANALEGDRQKCLAAGMDDYIAKPVNLEELAKVIRRVLATNDE